jgi:hypothetical protein
MKKPKLTIEDCGRFFDDYVLTHNKEIYISSYAKDLPRDLLKQCKRSPEHARAILEVYSTRAPKYCKNIEKSGEITTEQYNYILNKI